MLILQQRVLRCDGLEVIAALVVIALAGELPVADLVTKNRIWGECVSGRGARIWLMDITLQGFALGATIASPVVAALIFAASVSFDRRTRARGELAKATARARASVFGSAKWTTWPAPISHLGGWQLDALRDISELSALLASAGRVEFAKWLVKGAVQLGQANTASARLDAQKVLLEVLMAIDLDRRKGLGAAEQLALAHPWREVRAPAASKRFLLDLVLAAIRAVMSNAADGNRSNGGRDV